MASLLLERGADPNAASTRRTPIHIAIGWKQPQCVALLLAAGADLAAKDLDGQDARALVAKAGACAECRELVGGHTG